MQCSHWDAVVLIVVVLVVIIVSLAGLVVVIVECWVHVLCMCVTIVLLKYVHTRRDATKKWTKLSAICEYAMSQSLWCVRRITSVHSIEWYITSMNMLIGIYHTMSHFFSAISTAHFPNKIKKNVILFLALTSVLLRIGMSAYGCCLHFYLRSYYPWPQSVVSHRFMAYFIFAQYAPHSVYLRILLPNL